MLSCSLVELKPEAQHVIMSNDNSSCKRIGETTVKVLNEFLYFERNQDAVGDELEILAQNSAAKLGGNAIWPISEIDKGEQTFEVLTCSAKKIR